MPQLRHLSLSIALLILVPATAQTKKERIAALQVTVDSLREALEAARLRMARVEAERLQCQERQGQLQSKLELRASELALSSNALDLAESRADSLSQVLTAACGMTDAEMSELLSFYRDTTFKEVCFPEMHLPDISASDHDADPLPGRFDGGAAATVTRMYRCLPNMYQDVRFWVAPRDAEDAVGLYSFRLSDHHVGLITKVATSDLAGFGTRLWILDQRDRRMIADILLQMADGDAGLSINVGSCLFMDSSSRMNVLTRSYSSYLEPGDPDEPTDIRPEVNITGELIRISAAGVESLTSDPERIRQLHPRLHQKLVNTVGP